LILHFTEIYIISAIKFHTETWPDVRLATIGFGIIKKKEKENRNKPVSTEQNLQC